MFNKKVLIGKWFDCNLNGRCRWVKQRFEGSVRRSISTSNVLSGGYIVDNLTPAVLSLVGKMKISEDVIPRIPRTGIGIC